MPIFPIFLELKGLASQLNPLNAFNDQPSNAPSDREDATPKSTAEQPAGTPSLPAESGPGPSTLEKRSSIRGPNTTKPLRPSLKTGSSSSSSSLDGSGTRRSSGASVVIVDPIDGLPGKRDLDMQNVGEPRARSRQRTGTITSSVNSEPRRKKKAPLDTYIIVKPPAASAKNPLNLQVQLVVKEPRLRDRTASRSSLVSSSSFSGASPSTTLISPTSPGVDIPAPRASLQPVELASSADSKTHSDSPTLVVSSDEADDKAGGSRLTRSGSVKSNISSVTSSTGTTNGSRKRVEPMFNLTVHNVMQPTVVTDASTDVKVAKFHKRTLDISGVGALEPSEVWFQPPNSTLHHTLSAFTSNGDGSSQSRSRPQSIVSLTVPISPTVSRMSESNATRSNRNSVELAFKKFASEAKILRSDNGEENGAKKFFGKIFKKKQSESGPSSDRRPTIVLSKERSPSPARDELPNGSIRVQQPGSAENLNHHHGHATFGTTPVIIHRRSSGTIVTPDGAVTGLTAPSLIGPIAPTTAPPLSPSAFDSTDQPFCLQMLPSNRPIGYTWSVKKWSKSNAEGWAAHLVAAAAAGLDLVNGGFAGEGEDEVIFEWVKLRLPPNAMGADAWRRYSANGALSAIPNRPKKASRPKSRTPSFRGEIPPVAGGDPASTTLAVASEVGIAPVPPSPNLGPNLDPRPQPVRRVSATAPPPRRTSSNPPSIHESDKDHDDVSVTTNDLTNEEDSDPEDSETPWACSVWVKKTGQRQFLGSLTPAPHHPKVIAALKIPMSLDNVSLTNIKPSAHGAHAEVASRVKEELCLTEENLKDVVCVTAMWLVAREEFGGLGRKKRGSRV